MRAARVRKIQGLQELLIRCVRYSTRFWKFFLVPVLVTLLLRQFQLSRQVDSFYSEPLEFDYGPPPIVGTPKRRANTTGFVDPLSTVYDFNFTTIGERWREGVRMELMKEERKRMHNINPKSKKAADIRMNFQRLNKRLDDVETSEIDDPSQWHKVSPEGYKETLVKARSSMDEMVDKVYMDCVMWLLPHPSITAMEFEIDDRDITKLKKNPKTGPLIRFQCGGENQADGVLQDKPCRSANLCLVKSDPLAWASYYSNPSKIHNTSHINRSRNTVSSHYNHTNLQRQFATPKDVSNGPSKSAILTMVDTVHYLRSGKVIGRKIYGKSYFIWECFLNKASYAIRTNRDFYIWIGGFEGDAGDADSNSTTNSVLHQRNTEILWRTFGANCKPEIEDKNVVHYYKPIAFGALFRKLRSQRTGGDDQKVWFVDADIFFNGVAFPGRVESGHPPLSLDDYFDISPQASLLGSQNPSGFDNNILINGGLLGLKGSSIEPSDPLDDWVNNLSALWWYCRCGERDQIALWLLLFATWSAESSTNREFAYPGLVFENYLFSWYGVFPLAQTMLPQLQKSWINETQGSGSLTSKSTWSMTPTNARLFDGGKGFTTFSDYFLGGAYTYPLELPHVLLLPLDSFALPPNSKDKKGFDPKHFSPTRFDFFVSIIRKNQNKKSLLTHTKNVRDVCYKFKCWPYLIREDPTNKILLQEEKKKRNEIKKKMTEKKLKDNKKKNWRRM